MKATEMNLLNVGYHLVLQECSFHLLYNLCSYSKHHSCLFQLPLSMLFPGPANAAIQFPHNQLCAPFLARYRLHYNFIYFFLKYFVYSSKCDFLFSAHTPHKFISQVPSLQMDSLFHRYFRKSSELRPYQLYLLNLSIFNTVIPILCSM